MQILTILAKTIPVYERLSDISLNFIGKSIKWLIQLGGGNIGLGIILFTLALKLITLPLDIYSRATMRKSSLKMKKMRPQLEKLKKQYANDKAIYNNKIMELYKKEGYSMFSSCLPMIVTLVFFIVVLNAFQAYSRYETLNTFNNMRETYTAAVQEYAGSDNILDTAEINAIYAAGHISSPDDADAETFVIGYARKAAAEEYRKTDLSFLWVKNIWISDNATSHPVLSYSKFNSSIKLTGGEVFTEPAYDEITHDLSKEKKEPNGYFILILIAVGVTVLSQLVMTKSQKDQLEMQSVDGTGMQTQKMMMYMMPVMIGVFALMYTSAFCIYMITNSVLTIFSTLAINKIVDIGFKRKEEKEEQERLYGKFNRVNSAKNRKNQ